MFPSGSVSSEIDGGQASFTIKVIGEKESIKVFVCLIREPEEGWKVVNMDWVE